MFEHYSVADLFANLYKKRKSKYSSSHRFICYHCCTITIKAVKNKNTVKDNNKLFNL